MTWGIDLTSIARSELVGLEPDVSDAVADILMSWLAEGPPREDGRTVMDIPFYEALVAEDHLLAYTVDEERRRLAVLWIRARPTR